MSPQTTTSLEELGWLLNSLAFVARAENVVESVGESVTAKIESFIDDWFEFVEIGLWNGLVFIDTIVGCLGDAIGLHGEPVVVQTLVDRGIANNIRVVSHHTGDLWLEVVPGVLCERPCDVVVAVVHELVPEGVQLVDIIVVLEREQVATFVAIGELRVKQILAVQWLHQIPHVVDHQAQSVRLGDILIIFELVHQVGVDRVCLVVSALLAGEPGSDT